MADIFFSYSRKDKEGVGLVRNALAEMGFEVFWDQETPSGSDWDTWIRAELAKSKCAVVLWSASAILSDHVRPTGWYPNHSSAASGPAAAEIRQSL